MDGKRAVRRIASKQHGAVSRSQTLVAGMTRHQIAASLADGSLQIAARGVFVLDGSPNTWHRNVMVAVLRAGHGAAASHQTAAFLHGMLLERPSTIDVAVPANRRPRGIRRVHALSGADIRRVAGIPVTCPGRTLVDLASRGSREQEIALDNALVAGLATTEGLRRYVASRRLDH